MSSTVGIYLAAAKDASAVSHRIAMALRAPGYFYREHGYTYTISLTPLLHGSGVATLYLSDNDWDEDEPYLCAAFQAYNYELTIELGNVPASLRGEILERLGRLIFDHLMKLGCPLAFGDDTNIVADYLPGRGVREFPADTSWDKRDRDTWYEPALHSPDAELSPSHDRPTPPSGSMSVFETDGLIQIVPRVRDTTDRSHAVAPVASMRGSVDPLVFGRTLAEALSSSGQVDLVEGVDPWSWVTGTSRLNVEQFSRSAVSVDLELTGQSLIAIPRVPYLGSTTSIAQGTSVDELAVNDSRSWDDQAIGETILNLINSVRLGS
ncbi:hypothetical protein D0T12_10770 [Actinomadura spongiicola]|uniref:Uncharacterized protein n=1 Tax=Actinomadura spongiicola TaxID=2303421 RepID=A0A372GJE0_9ACTN|nr:hypothetical protein [Actinomadura spongiicola]RFS85506.1 hypothetical protein D0T12_10770 [Actinomadura spongiicola]